MKTSNLEQIVKGKERKEMVVLKRSFGRNALQRVADTTIHSVIGSVVELAANAYDADASKVEITYDPENRTLSIEDNGTGMTPEDLRPFYWIGDSPKEKQTISKRGRRVIGKFGIATIHLNYLCGNYTLDTQKGGTKTVIEEVFGKELNPDESIPYQCSVVEKERTGTTIVMRDLKFEEGPIFNLKKLRSAIQWGLPILPDFQIFVNGWEVTSRSIEKALTFEIDKTGKQMGRISGYFYYTSRPTENKGVHIYVNGRAVGDPDEYVHDLKSYLFSNQLVGIIEANDLEPAIRFDRGGFREDYPGVHELRETIVTALSKIEREIERSAQNKGYDLKKKRPTFLKNLKAIFVSKGISGISKESAIDFSKEVPPEESGFFEPISKTLYLNEKSPLLAIHPKIKGAAYEAFMRVAAVESIALGQLRKQGRTFTVEEFLAERNQILLECLGEREGTTQPILHPDRVYQPSELSDYSNVSVGSINYLTAGNVLKLGKEGITGQDYLDVLKRTNGLTTLYEITRRKDQTNYAYQLKSFERRVEQAGREAIPFIANLGVTQPCFFVEDVCSDEIYKRLSAIDLRSQGADAAAELKLYGSRFLTIPEIKRETGLEMTTTSKIMEYAQKERLTIRKEKINNTIRFNFRDVIQAYQVMRGI